MTNHLFSNIPKRGGVFAALLIAGLLLAGCSIPNPLAAPIPTPAPTISVAPTATPEVISTPDAGATTSTNFNGLIYNAEILPDAQVPIVAEVAGQILQMNVEMGDHVQAGDVLAQIDTVLAEAQRAQAEAGLQAAQAQLELATADPEETDLEAARAAVKAADEAYKRALQGATAEDRKLALTQVRQAEEAVKLAQAQYDRIAGNPFAGMMPEAYQLQQATFGLEAAQTQYDKVLKGATPDMIAGAYAQLAGAKAQLARLEQGAKPAQIKAAEAGVKQAEAALFLAQTQVDKATVKAPIDGVVAQVMAAEGSMAGPGAPLLALLSEDVKLIVSVEEALLTKLYLGQPVTITVDAYPDREFSGEVVIIAPALDPATRTIPVTIRPTGDASDLRPGMFATVTIQEK
ncbi:MAG TPA: HlyD family efflux transporter periplasmic adaptor subunit [Caldilineae bacterium]|nr:HlyD family efflux transporter periplasmic adaptor subunit [Caldilineae bacterium]